MSVTLALIKAKNQRFFDEEETRFFGTYKVELRGLVVTTYNRTEGMDRNRILEMQPKYYADPQHDYELMPLKVEGNVGFFYRGGPNGLRRVVVDLTTGFEVKNAS